MLIYSTRKRFPKQKKALCWGRRTVSIAGPRRFISEFIHCVSQQKAFCNDVQLLYSIIPSAQKIETRTKKCGSDHGYRTLYHKLRRQQSSCYWTILEYTKQKKTWRDPWPDPACSTRCSFALTFRPWTQTGIRGLWMLLAYSIRHLEQS